LKCLLNYGIKIYQNIAYHLTIQKPYDVDRTMFGATSFANAIKVKPFDGSNFKRWRELATLWLTAMNVMYVATGKAPEGVSEEKFNADDNLFQGAIISVLVDNLVDTYLQRKTGKDIWEALEAQYGATDTGGELYVMEQFLDYRMVEDRSVVEQAYEVQALAKELENYSKEAPCVLPNKFVAGAIITKLSHFWRDFATSLKHKRKEFTFDDLIATLDVEEKVRAKDTREKAIAGSSSANFVQRGNLKFHNNQNKRKKPSQNPPKAKEADGPNKKRKPGGSCCTCGSPDHFAAKCPDRKDRKAPKTTNMVVSEGGRTSGYGNFLPTVLSVCSSPEWWIDTGANIHVCANISIFSSYQVGGTTSLLMGNGAHARVLGAGTVTLKFTSGKTIQLKNVQHVPTIKKN
jgi:hypothetical protein